MSSPDIPNDLSIEGYLIRYFEWNKKIFEVVNNPCNLDDTKKLIAGIICQAVKDFERLASPKTRKRKADRENWITACGFLFDNEYMIPYGDIEMTFGELLAVVSNGDGFNLNSLRQSLIQKTIHFWSLQGETLDDDFYCPYLGSI